VKVTEKEEKMQNKKELECTGIMFRKVPRLCLSLSRTAQLETDAYWFGQFIDPRYSKVTFSKAQTQDLSVRITAVT
jgi:hypothetical protein